MKTNKLLLIPIITMLACIQQKSTNDRPRAKFEPADGEVILFAGQELEAIGGLNDYNDGYLDHFDAPAGFTAYTNLSPGDTSFGHINKGLDGIFELADWGDHDEFLNLQLADPDFENMVLAIGLSLVGHENSIATGKHDSLVVVLGNWLKALNGRPVFLRVGYEFDGHLWNSYDRQGYLKAYKRIKDKLDEMGVNNVAYVWQSVGWVSTPEILEEWYPGDEYVDWCGFSFFDRWKEQEMIAFARKKGKPVFIAEASPTISGEMAKFTGKTKETVLSNPEQAMEAYEKWFLPLFKTINDNPDVVKAVSYINCHWKSHRMWFENPTFQDVDARLQTSDFIAEKWKEETAKKKYLKASPDLFRYLENGEQ